MQNVLTNFTPKRVGVIGCGHRAMDLIPLFETMDTNARVTDICDLYPELATARLKERRVDPSGIKFWTNARDMLDNAEIDGVIVATMWPAHAELAEMALTRNIPLFLEKPITFSMDEMIRIRDAYQKSNKLAMVSHPLTVSPLLTQVREIIQSGRIGSVEHIMAFNYANYGGIYFHSKYRTSGRAGLFYEKSTHDLDWVNYILDEKPILVASMASQSVFGGNEPEAKLCAACDKQLTCMESPFMQKNFVHDQTLGEFCSFAKDVSTYDSASILVQYESGRHANYVENHVARKNAGGRGGRITGYAGTVDFNWYHNTITVTRHHASTVEKHQIETHAEHSGGDSVLVYDFLKMMHGINDTAVGMDRCMVTNLLAMAAHKSLDEKVFVPVLWGDGQGV